MIEPDHKLPWTPEALCAWHRITGALERSGQWSEIYRVGSFVSATQAAAYLTCCRLHGVHAEVTKECRAVARLWLTDMAWLDSAEPGRLDDLGRDVDLLELCMPAEDATA